MHRPRLALVLALGALGAAGLGAIGPAAATRTVYSWPPETLRGEAPTRAWYTPLLLIRHRPEKISAVLPCAPAPALAASPSRPTVLATARSPRTTEGLAVTLERRGMEVAVGENVLARLPRAARETAGTGCAYRLVVDRGRWSIDGPSGEVAEGELAAMPVVSGLFSTLDLRDPRRPTVALTAARHGGETTAWQTVLWTLATLAAAAALLLVAIGSGHRPRSRLGASSVREVVTSAHPVDALVVGVLIAWWVLSPSFLDDGWVMARQDMFSSASGFTNYYDTLGANVPLGYWLEWAQHWLVQSSDTLLVLRLPALLALGTAWVLCRWLLARMAVTRGVPLWALATAFLVGAMAWGMTLRPEPFTALLTLGALACCARFLERGTPAPLAGVALLAPLALMGHHAGVVALAPVLVVSPSVLRWARDHAAEGVALLTASLALLVTLAFLGSDFDQRRADTETYRALTSTSTSWRDELLRYARLSEFPNASPLRRESVALIALAVLAFLLRKRRAPQPLLDLPAAALGLGLVLLVATPSKWAWHFGALLGVAAVAVAAETARLRDDAAVSRGWSARPLLVVGAASLVGAWLWSPRSAWSRLDLRTMEWTLGIESSIPIWQLAFVLPFVAVLVAGIVELVRHGSSRLDLVPWRIAVWCGPLLAVPAIAFTVGVLAADTAKTSSWTLARQNLQALGGDDGCGLAEDVLVVDERSLRPLSGTKLVRGIPVAQPTAPPAPEGLPSFLLGARVGAVATPWFELPDDRRFGLFVARPSGSTGTLELEWGRRDGGRTEKLGSAEIPAYESSQPESSIDSWGFHAASELPVAPASANVVRIKRADGLGSGPSVGVTTPVTYTNEPLSRRLSAAGARTLVLPDLVPYFPCASRPLLADDVVQVPRFIVTPFEGSSWLESWETSPFEGLLDLYPLERLSVADSRDRPAELAVLHVDDDISGDRLLPAVRSTVTIR